MSNGFAFAQLRQLCLLIGAMNILHGIMQLVGKLQSLDRVHGVIHTMSSAYRFLSAQHHFRVVDKIPVDGKTVIRLSGLESTLARCPAGGPAFEEDDVRYHLGTGVSLNASPGQTDGSPAARHVEQDTGARWNSLASIVAAEVTKPPRRRDAPGPVLWQKVVVDAEIQLVVGFISNLILAERALPMARSEVTPVGGPNPATVMSALG